MSPLQEAIDAVLSYQWHGPREQLAALERLVKEARLADAMVERFDSYRRGTEQAGAIIKAEREAEYEERAALMDKVRRLVAMTEQPNPDDPQRYYIKPGEGLNFSALVRDCAQLVTSAEDMA